MIILNFVLIYSVQLLTELQVLVQLQKGAFILTLLYHLMKRLHPTLVVLGGSHVLIGGIDVTTWQTYTGAINIINDKSQTGTFEYYSTDTAGNMEVTKTEALQ